MINEYIVDSGPFNARNLPPVGAFIRTYDGKLYNVSECVPETREFGDSAKGYVYALRIGDGERNYGRIAKRRTRVYGASIRVQVRAG